MMSGTRLGWVVAVAVAMASFPLASRAETCTTQSKMNPNVYTALTDASLGLAVDVKAGDAAKVQAATVPDFAANFASTAYLIRTTGDAIAGDTLRVTQVYLLDAATRAEGDTGEADFTCPLQGTTAETDFGIPALPPGTYSFAMVEAAGARPWLLAFVLRRDSGVWKMAGFSAHARDAAGHDGLWFWTHARDAAKDKQAWLAWLDFGEADELLRPAGFVTSTNRDKLLSEQRAAAPPELAEGIGPENPIVLKGANGVDYRFTAIASQGSDDGKRLELVLHVRAEDNADPATEKVFNIAAAQALLVAHKELRAAFYEVSIFAESAGHAPVLTQLKMADVPQ
jgi:hypothetical protein